jgi:hypothetical protein
LPKSHRSSAEANRRETIRQILERLDPKGTASHEQLALALERQVCSVTRKLAPGVTSPSSVLQRAFVKASSSIREGGPTAIEDLQRYVSVMMRNLSADVATVSTTIRRAELAARAEVLRRRLQQILAEAESVSRPGAPRGGSIRGIRTLASRTPGRMRPRALVDWIAKAEDEIETWLTHSDRPNPGRGTRHATGRTSRGSARATPSASASSRRVDPELCATPSLEVLPASEQLERSLAACCETLRWLSGEPGKPGQLAARRLEVLVELATQLRATGRLGPATELHRTISRHVVEPVAASDLLHKRCSREKNCGGCRIARLDFDWCLHALRLLSDDHPDALNFATLRDFGRSLRGSAAREQTRVLDCLQDDFGSERVRVLRSSPAHSAAWSDAARSLSELQRRIASISRD